MYVTSDAATREIWTWVPSVILDPSPPCWSGNPLWLSKFNQKNLIYDVLRHRKITNAIHQVMSTYSGTGINTPYTTGLPSPMRRHVFLYINYESMYWICLFDFQCFWVIFSNILRIMYSTNREYPGSMAGSEILSSLTEVMINDPKTVVIIQLIHCTSIQTIFTHPSSS